MTHYDYDALNRLTRVTREVPGESSRAFTAYEYDAAGNVRRITYGEDVWQQGRRTGQRITAEETFTFDGPLLLRHVDPHGLTTTNRYDLAGRLMEQTQESGGVRRVTRFRYNAAGHLVEIIDPAGHVTRQAHDYKGRVTRIDHPDSTVEHYRYNALYLIRHTVTGPGGDTRWTEWDYAADGKVTAIRRG